MKDFLKNKKIIFPIVIGLVIIVIAIIIFILIGKSTNNSGKVSTIKLSNSTGNNSTTNVTNATDNTNENTSDNTSNDTSNSTSDDDTDFEFDGDEFYLDAAKSFMNGLKDEDDMKQFVDKHVDVKAYAAAFTVNGDDAEFMDEYEGLDDDDSKVEKIEEKFLELVSEDNDYSIKSISDPKESGDDEQITRVTVSFKSGSETIKYRMVFYGEIVIYICDENGDSVINLND